MFLEAIKKRYVKELTAVSVVAGAAGTVACHLFVPGGCFAWYASVPAFFFLFGLFYIRVFAFSCTLGEGKIAMAHLVCKALKLILSVLLLLFYGFVIGREVVAFTAVFLFFYFTFLIFETRFFFRFEVKLKLSKQIENEKNTVHSNHTPAVAFTSGDGAEGGDGGR